MALPPRETDLLVAILAEQAASSFAGPRLYFRDLVGRAHWPRGFEQSVAGVWSGDSKIDARQLVVFASGKGTNPADARATTLGSLLLGLLPDLGLEDRARVAAILHARRLLRDAELAGALVDGMQIPTPPPPTVAAAELAAVQGPDIAWEGPADDLELQGWLRPEPDWLDVGFLARAIASAAGVCRIEVSAPGPRGTGFMLGQRDLVLTNYHVLEKHADGVEAAARATVLRFGAMTLASGEEAGGREVRTDPGSPLVKASPTDELDYALLRVDAAILAAEELVPAPLAIGRPAKGSPLHLLQHPHGGPMKVALSDDAVTAVVDDRFVQYVSRSATGSSGAPCFDEQWRVVAVHHAERSRTFGTIREGILLSAIGEQLKELAPAFA